jgi:hypothetical protein
MEKRWKVYGYAQEGESEEVSFVLLISPAVLCTKRSYEVLLLYEIKYQRRTSWRIAQRKLAFLVKSFWEGIVIRVVCRIVKGPTQARSSCIHYFRSKEAPAQC